MTVYLRNISWSFTETWEDLITFSEAVRQYQMDIHQTDAHWDPHEMILGEPEIYIQYEAWISSPAELLENEQFAQPRNLEARSSGYYESEIVARLTANNKAYFTACELLLKTHHQLSSKELGDHVFFEGFALSQHPYHGKPLLVVRCGS